MIVQVILDGYTVRASDATQLKPYNMTDGWDGYGDGFGDGKGFGEGRGYGAGRGYGQGWGKSCGHEGYGFPLSTKTPVYLLLEE